MATCTSTKIIRFAIVRGVHCHRRKNANYDRHQHALLMLFVAKMTTMAMKLSRSDIKQIGLMTVKNEDRTINDAAVDALFRGCFGCSVNVVTIVWNLLVVQLKVPAKGVPKHVFWALALMKSYRTEAVYSAWFHVDAFTFRKWAWAFILAMSRLDVVSIFSG
jgi:hypothetical protein